MTMERLEFRIIDANNNLYMLKVEGDEHFSFMGRSGFCSGQIRNDIKPSSKLQEKLISTWKELHLKPFNKNGWKRIENLVEKLNKEYEQALGESWFDITDDTNDIEMCNYISINCGLTEYESACAISVLRMLDLPFSAINHLEIDEDLKEEVNKFSVYGIGVYADTDDRLAEHVKNLYRSDDYFYVEDVKNGYRESFETWLGEQTEYMEDIYSFLNSYDGTGKHFYIGCESGEKEVTVCLG